MSKVLEEIAIAAVLAFVAWLGFAVWTSESAADDVLVSIAARTNAADPGISGDASPDVGVILIGDRMLQAAMSDQTEISGDVVASSYRSIVSELLEIISEDGKAQAVLIDFYADPYSRIVNSISPDLQSCDIPIVQVVLPPRSPFEPELVYPDETFLSKGNECVLMGMSFANNAAGGNLVRTIDHGILAETACPVFSLSASPLALTLKREGRSSEFEEDLCQRQRAIRDACKADKFCADLVSSRRPFTPPPESLSVRYAHEFFDPDFAESSRDWLADRVVFIGSANSASDDYFRLSASPGRFLASDDQLGSTPWPGVVLHAGLAQSIFDARDGHASIVRYAGGVASAVFGFIVAIMSWVILRRRIDRLHWRTLTPWLALSVIGSIVGSLAAAVYGLIVSIAFLLCGIGIAAVAMYIAVRTRKI